MFPEVISDVKSWQSSRLTIPLPLVCNEQCIKVGKLDTLQSMDGQWTLAPSQESSSKSSNRSDCTLTKRIHALLLPVYSTYSEAWTFSLLSRHIPYVAAPVNTLQPKLDQGVSFQAPAELNCITSWNSCSN